MDSDIPADFPAQELVAEWAKEKGLHEIVPVILEKGFTFERLGKVYYDNIEEELHVHNVSLAQKIIQAIDESAQ